MVSVNDDPLHLRYVPPRHLLDGGNIPREVYESISLAFVDIIVDLTRLGCRLHERAAEGRLSGSNTAIATYVPFHYILCRVKGWRPKAHRLQHLKRGRGWALQFFVLLFANRYLLLLLISMARN